MKQKYLVGGSMIPGSFALLCRLVLPQKLNLWLSEHVPMLWLSCINMVVPRLAAACCASMGSEKCLGPFMRPAGPASLLTLCTSNFIK
jgi:hypothetical protein